MPPAIQNQSAITFIARNESAYTIGEHRFNLAGIRNFSYNPSINTGFRLRLESAVGERLKFNTSGGSFSVALQYAEAGADPSTISSFLTTTTSFVLVDLDDLQDASRQPITLPVDYVQVVVGTGLYRDRNNKWSARILLRTRPFSSAVTFSALNIRFMHFANVSGGIARRAVGDIAWSLSSSSVLSADFVYPFE